jgi:eukaryotic-like serine/threonine-protein kinase
MAETLTDVLDRAGVELVRTQIGGGGSATVHQGRVSQTGEGLPVGTLVAVKEYHPSLVATPGQLDRIRQEAALGQQLRHPHVVQTYRLYEPIELAGAPTVLILEWVEGRTLDQWYAAQPRPVKWEIIRSICLNVIDGVAELHARSTFHRDLKPENIMVRTSGAAVVMDIGVAEITDSNEHTLHTSVRDFVGSVRFASPQFILGDGQFTAADDIYSLGATFFLLFTGRMIYEEVERKPVLPIMVVNDPPRIDSLAEEIPPAMKVLLQGCLHRERKRRPSLSDLAESIRNPEGATYITRELELQAAESRSYPVIEILDDGASFLADLSGDNPEVGDTYRVVRPGRKITVPSYNREITPETWVAEAVLKHVHANVGHFILWGRRWQEGKNSLYSMIGAIPGQWVEQEKLTPKVRKNDVLKQAVN